MVEAVPDLKILTKLVAVIAICGLAQGCVSTSYHNMGKGKAASQINERMVSFWVNDRVFSRMYSCVFVVPAKETAFGVLQVAERSLQRHLYEKFDRVIPGHSVKRIARRKLIEIGNTRGIRRFGEKMNCPVTASIQVRELKNDFMVFYARKSLKLEVSLKDAKTNELLWQASHNAGRGDGALPLSPLSAVSSVIRASRLSGDGEQFASIVDDAVRRMARTLPSFRLDHLEASPPTRLNRG